MPMGDDPITTGLDAMIKKETADNLKDQNALLREQTKKTAAETAATAADARRIGAIADKEEISKLPYTMARDYLMPGVKGSAQDIANELKKSGKNIKIKFGDHGGFQ